MGQTPTFQARRAAVAAASSLLTGLSDAVVGVGNDELGPFLREVDDLSRQMEAARVALLAEALNRGVVAASDCATAAAWVIQWAPTFRAGFVQVATDHGPNEIRGLRDQLIAVHGQEGEFARRQDQLKYGVSLSQPVDDDGMGRVPATAGPRGQGSPGGDPQTTVRAAPGSSESVPYQAPRPDH